MSTAHDPRCSQPASELHEASLQHLNTLSHALSLALMPKERDDMLQSAKLARLMLDAGVPCGDVPYQAVDSFICHVEWAGVPELRQLFNDYVARGVIELNTPCSRHRLRTLNYPNKSLPLEAALQLVNIECFFAMLEEGADPALIPGPFYADYSKVKDVYGFIADRMSPEQGAGVAARLTEYLMKRRIDGSDSRELTTAPPLQARRPKLV